MQKEHASMPHQPTRPWQRVQLSSLEGSLLSQALFLPHLTIQVPPHAFST